MDAAHIAQAIAALDAANAADPARTESGQAEALRYADGISRWVARLQPQASHMLRIAARAQHLERWGIPRSDFAMDRPGYHRWRRAVQIRQGKRASELLAGILDTESIARIASLVAKSAPSGDGDAQALEDAACLVFLEAEIAGFAAAHQDYDAERYITILRKTWAKMSETARGLAKALPLDEPFAGLLRQALAS